jgi:hypothetical protein
MRVEVLALLVTAGCVASPHERYPVDAVAQLEPLQLEPRVTGQIELLGTGMPIDIEPSVERTIAAYRVHVSDDLPHAVTLLNATSCIEPPVRPLDPFPSQYLGVIRYIANETHFFMREVQLDGRTIDLDTGTAIAYASPTDRNKRIVIVSEHVDGGATLACGVLTWR